jgi:hypothetical protein
VEQEAPFVVYDDQRRRTEIEQLPKLPLLFVS